jgi:ABC-type multidrug transport system fused ATPase/permease subunit
MKTRGFIMVLFALAVIAGFSAIVMLLWNSLFTSIFDLAAINFWQAGGLLIFARILFGGGFGRRMTGLTRFGEGGFGKNPIRERWQKMTPEERKEFINRRKEWGKGPFGRHDFFGARGFDFEANDEPKKDNE